MFPHMIKHLKTNVTENKQWNNLFMEQVEN